MSFLLKVIILLISFAILIFFSSFSRLFDSCGCFLVRSSTSISLQLRISCPGLEQKEQQRVVVVVVAKGILFSMDIIVYTSFFFTKKINQFYTIENVINTIVKKELKIFNTHVPLPSKITNIILFKTMPL
jgi:hypothetical protein